jgi:hypothetical protein
MNTFKIPLIWPFKMVPATPTPGIHFDDDWTCNQIKSFETKVYYQQKWVKTDVTKLQVESSVVPASMQIYSRTGQVVKTINWEQVFAGTSYSIYELAFDIHDLPDGIYFIYAKATFGGIDYPAISEPIYSKSAWPNTLLFTYNNSFNDFGIAWTTGIRMKFRCEAAIMDFTPQRGATDYVDQLADKTVLSGYPSRQLKLYVGDQRGVPPYVPDILNRIFDCDSVDINGKNYTADSDKWEINRVKGYPFVGASIDIVPSVNEYSLEFSDVATLSGHRGRPYGYNIETEFFGPGAQVPIIEVEES